MAILTLSILDTKVSDVFEEQCSVDACSISGYRRPVQKAELLAKLDSKTPMNQLDNNCLDEKLVVYKACIKCPPPIDD